MVIICPTYTRSHLALSQYPPVQARDNQEFLISDILLSLRAHILVSPRCSPCCSDRAVVETHIFELLQDRIERYVTFEFSTLLLCHFSIDHAVQVGDTV